MQAHWKSTIPTCLTIIAACGWMATAGDLDPPAGPVQPTMKTLNSVEPRIEINAINTPGDADSTFRITQPGSYYLAGNLTAQAGKRAIEITAPNVKIHFQGFTMQGNPSALSGIRINTTQPGTVTLERGTVDGFGGAGIEIVDQPSEGVSVVLREIQSSRNSVNGVSVGANAQVTAHHVLFYANSGEGAAIGQGADFAGEGVSCYFNSLSALRVESQSSVRIRNGRFFASGSNGIEMVDSPPLQGSSVHISDARFFANNQNGASVGANNFAVLSNVTVRKSGMDGIHAAAGSFLEVDGSRITENVGGGVVSSGEGTVVQDSDTSNNGAGGVVTGDNANIKNTQANNNGQAGAGDGIKTGDSSTVQSCTANNNTTDGIDVGNYSVTIYTIANNNGGAGMTLGAGGSVTNGTANGNGGNGIQNTNPNSDTNLQIYNSTSSGNTQNGFRTGSYAGIYNSTAFENSQDGFFVNGFVYITDSIATNNTLVGYNAGGAGVRIINSTSTQNAMGAQVFNGSQINGGLYNLNTDVGVFVGGPSVSITNATISDHTQGSAVGIDFQPGTFAGIVDGNQLTGNTTAIRFPNAATGGTAVTSNYFAFNGTNIVEPIPLNKIGTIQCNPATAGPHDNWQQ